MDTGLKDAKALVLASSGGLGLAIGQELLSEGASVMLSSRDSERLEAAAATMRTAAGSGDRVLPQLPMCLTLIQFPGCSSTSDRHLEG